MYIGQVEQFTSFSQFKSLQDFNNNIEMWLFEHKNDFSKKELVCLKRLIRFSSKIFGVSTTSINKLLKAIQDKDHVKVSEATFHRMKRKAIKLGVLSVHTTKRTNNSQSANVWVFNTYQINHDTPSESQKHATNQQSQNKERHPSKTSNNSKTSNLINKRKENFDYSYVSSNVPEPFVDTVRPFFSRPKDIYKVYSKLILAIRKHGTESLKISHMNELCKTFKESIHRYKNRNIKADIYGYLYGSFSNKVRELTMEQNVKGKGVYYNWLEPTHEQSL